MKLYVDDIRPCPVGWHCARTVEEAKHLILRAAELGLAWEAVSLDHDMGACADCLQTQDFTGVMPYCSHVGTGYDLLRWMITENRWPLSKPSVHSMNIQRAICMRQDINRYFPNA